MKKYIVLSVLFVLPIVVYLFFASGVTNFGKLPILKQHIKINEPFLDANNSVISLRGKITVLGFLGTSIEQHQVNALNLNQKIYKRFNGFDNFQVVFVQPKESKTNANKLFKELSALTDTSNWHFVYTSEGHIETLFESLQTNYSLSNNFYTPFVFIIDKDLNLRGRKKDDDTKQVLYGYDASSVAVLNNKMIDDMKVLLAEYRLAHKKNYKGSKRNSYLNKVEK